MTRTDLPEPFASWTAHRRDADGELLGFLSEGDLPGTAVPRTVFGYPLAEARTRVEAEQVLDSTGLAYLTEGWELTVDDHPDPITVQIVEAGPHRVVLASSDLGYHRDVGTRFRLDPPRLTGLRRTGRR